jgi:hypothetical protein
MRAVSVSASAAHRAEHGPTDHSCESSLALTDALNRQTPCLPDGMLCIGDKLFGKALCVSAGAVLSEAKGTDATPFA